MSAGRESPEGKWVPIPWVCEQVSHTTILICFQYKIINKDLCILTHKDLQQAWLYLGPLLTKNIKISTRTVKTFSPTGWHAGMRSEGVTLASLSWKESQDLRIWERRGLYPGMRCSLEPHLPFCHTLCHRQQHTHTHFKSHATPPSNTAVQSACSSGPQQIVNNEWFFYKSRCVAVEALSVLGQPASLHLTAFSLLLLLLLLLAGQPLLNALPKALQCRPRDCWLLSPGKYCALSRNLSTPVDITAEASDSRGQAKCRVSS